MVAALRIDADRILVTAVLSGGALVHFDTVELVVAPIARQTFAHIRAECVDTLGVRMAVIPIETTFLSALINV
jgi:hypothetical protein